MNYREEKEASKRFKQEYADGLEQLITLKQEEAARKRGEYIKDIFTRPEDYRNGFRSMLGWPLVDHTDNAPPRAESELLSEEEGYSVYRMRFTILDVVTVTGLFFKMATAEKRPLVIVQHGGLGTPELISGVYGDTANYNDMLQRVIRHNVHAFAPQLMLWHDDYGVPFNRVNIDARLKRVGSSITAVEVHAISRILDYFEQEPYISSFGMVGLSYGGFYTLFTAAADTRIRASISCSFFNKRDAVPWSDWTWFKSAETFDDAEIACLVWPRKIWLQIGKNDPLFKAEFSQEAFDRICEMCDPVGTDWVEFSVFDGVHEFSHDDTPIAEMVCLLEQ